MDASGNYGYYKDGADTVTPFRSSPKTLGVSFAWSGSQNGNGVSISKTLTIPPGLQILCFCGGDTYFKYTINTSDEGNLKTGDTYYKIASYDDTTGIVTVQFYFRPFTSCIYLKSITASGTLYYY